MDFKSLYLLRQNKIVCIARKGQMLLNFNSKELVWSSHAIALVISNNNSDNNLEILFKNPEKENTDM